MGDTSNKRKFDEIVTSTAAPLIHQPNKKPTLQKHTIVRDGSSVMDANSKMFLDGLVNGQFECFYKSKLDYLLFNISLPILEESGNYLVLKVSEYQNQIDSSHFECEYYIYKSIIPKVYAHTPHVVPVYGSYTFDSPYFLETRDKTGRAILNTIPNEYRSIKFIHRYLSNIATLYPIRGFTTYRVDGVSLEEYIQSRQFTTNDLDVIFFQIVYTLLCMKYTGLKHNDLHLRNIIITQHSGELETDYIIPVRDDNTNYTKMVRVKSNIQVSIYDFDRSTVWGYEDAPRNYTLDVFFCQQYNQCVSPQPDMDIYSVVVSLTYFLGSSLRHLETEVATKEFGGFFAMLSSCFKKNGKAITPMEIHNVGEPYIHVYTNTGLSQHLRTTEEIMCMFMEYIEAKSANHPLTISKIETLTDDIRESSFVLPSPINPKGIEYHLKTISNPEFATSLPKILKQLKIPNLPIVEQEPGLVLMVSADVAYEDIVGYFNSIIKDVASYHSVSHEFYNGAEDILSNAVKSKKELIGEAYIETDMRDCVAIHPSDQQSLALIKQNDEIYANHPRCLKGGKTTFSISNTIFHDLPFMKLLSIICAHISCYLYSLPFFHTIREDSLVAFVKGYMPRTIVVYMLNYAIGYYIENLTTFLQSAIHTIIYHLQTSGKLIDQREYIVDQRYDVDKFHKYMLETGEFDKVPKVEDEIRQVATDPKSYMYSLTLLKNFPPSQYKNASEFDMLICEQYMYDLVVYTISYLISKHPRSILSFPYVSR